MSDSAGTGIFGTEVGEKFFADFDEFLFLDGMLKAGTKKKSSAISCMRFTTL